MNIDREQLATFYKGQIIKEVKTDFVHPTEWVNINDVDMYEQLASTTAKDSIKNNLNYFTLGLVGEAGEIANKVKKIIRDNEGEVTEEQKTKLAAELGDIAWYFVGLCRLLGVKPSSVLAGNINKLFDRKERGVIGGSGDNR